MAIREVRSPSAVVAAGSRAILMMIKLEMITGTPVTGTPVPSARSIDEPGRGVIDARAIPDDQILRGRRSFLGVTLSEVLPSGGESRRASRRAQELHRLGVERAASPAADARAHTSR